MSVKKNYLLKCTKFRILVGMKYLNFRVSPVLLQGTVSFLKDRFASIFAFCLMIYYLLLR